MPCDSVITNTAMTNAERLADAMRSSGHSNVRVERDGLYVRSDTLDFFRYNNDLGFRTTATGASVDAVGRAYAAASVREWARRAGYNIVTLDAETGAGVAVRRR